LAVVVATPTRKTPAPIKPLVETPSSRHKPSDRMVDNEVVHASEALVVDLRIAKVVSETFQVLQAASSFPSVIRSMLIAC